MSKASASHSSSSGHSSGKRSHLSYDGSMRSAKDGTAQAFSKEVVPYPFSIDRETQQLWAMDRQIILDVQGQMCHIDWKGKPPKRCLDLCCGLGDWVVHSAKLWLESTFVGMDISREQINLKYLDPSISNRIEWVHGNILEGLPFADSEFDFVHMFATCFCVPEDKLHFIYEEVSRVLKPGGTIQQMEEDAIFPVLPRWFTVPLHGAGRSRDGTSHATPLTPTDMLPHDHALLEKLYYAAFENRFIPPTASSVLPSYFSAKFKHVLCPPVLSYYMPPLAPLPPFSRDIIPAMSQPMKIISEAPQLPMFQSTVIAPTDRTSRTSLPPSRRSSQPPSSSARSTSSVPDPSTMPKPLLPRTDSTQSISSTHSLSNKSGSGSSGSGFNSANYFDLEVGPDTTHLGDVEETLSLVNLESLGKTDEHSLYVHLYHVVGTVKAAKPRMWEELREMVLRHDESLAQYGWKQYDYTEEASRKKFEKLWDRFRFDTHERIAMWHSMMHYGWAYPRQSAMTDAEIAEREELREAILAARELADNGQPPPPLRVIRLMVGLNDKDI